MADADEKKAEDATADTDMKEQDASSIAETKDAKIEDATDVKTNGEEASHVNEAVAERLHFFFSDANVRQDKFMRSLLMKSDGKYPHQVEISALLRFNTIKKITTDPAVIIATAKNSPLLKDKLVVSSDGKAIGRVEVFTKNHMEGSIPLSLHLRNLPLKDEGEGKPPKRYDVTVQEVRDLFTQYGTVAMVRLRYGYPDHHDKNKKENQKYNPHRKKTLPLGAALVEFEKIEALEAAAADTLTYKAGVEVEPKRKLKLGDKELEVKLLKEKIEDKKREEESQEVDSVEAENKEKQQQDEEQDKADEKKPEAKAEKEDEKRFSLDWKPGCVIRLKGLAEECDREALLSSIAKGLDKTADEVKSKKIYVDYSRGQKDGAIRFYEPEDSIKALCEKYKSGELEVAGQKVETAYVLEGDEESTYWKEFIDFKNNQMQSGGYRRNDKRGKNHGGGGRGYHNKRARR